MRVAASHARSPHLPYGHHVPGLLGVNPAPQPMDLSASSAAHQAASVLYVAVAVLLPLMALALIGLRAAGARTRWARWLGSDAVGWAWRMPYELFVVAAPALAVVFAERLAVIALSSGENRTPGANRLICATITVLFAMGISAARSGSPRRSPGARARTDISRAG